MTLSGGIDLRHYTGEHYREVYDLLGGDYYVANDNVAASDSSALENCGVSGHRGCQFPRCRLAVLGLSDSR